MVLTIQNFDCVYWYKDLGICEASWLGICEQGRENAFNVVGVDIQWWTLTSITTGSFIQPVYKPSEERRGKEGTRYFLNTATRQGSLSPFPLWSDWAVSSIIHQIAIEGILISYPLDVIFGPESTSRLRDTHSGGDGDGDGGILCVIVSALPRRWWISHILNCLPGLRAGRLVPGALDPRWDRHQQQLSWLKLAALGGRGPPELPQESAQPLHCHPWVVSVRKCHGE